MVLFHLYFSSCLQRQESLCEGMEKEEETGDILSYLFEHVYHLEETPTDKTLHNLYQSSLLTAMCSD